MFSVIHRTELAHVQQFGQLVRVDAVALAAFFQQGIFSRITHYEFRHVRLQQIVQPAGPSAFFKREVHISTQPVDKLQKVLALVSMTHSITTLPAEFRTAIEMLSLCTSK